jgi:hypothetical protein
MMIADVVRELAARRRFVLQVVSAGDVSISAACPSWGTRAKVRAALGLPWSLWRSALSPREGHG